MITFAVTIFLISSTIQNIFFLSFKFWIKAFTLKTVSSLEWISILATAVAAIILTSTVIVGVITYSITLKGTASCTCSFAVLSNNARIFASAFFAILVLSLTFFYHGPQLLLASSHTPS